MYERSHDPRTRTHGAALMELRVGEESRRQQQLSGEDVAAVRAVPLLHGQAEEDADGKADDRATDAQERVIVL